MKDFSSKTRSISLYRNDRGTNTIFNSQAATLFFIVGIAFKLSAAPGMLNEEFGSSTFWVFLTYSLIDVALAACVFAFCRRDGDALLRATNSGTYKVICLIACAWLTLKGLLHFSYASSYLTHELFEGLEPSLIYIIFLLPIIYLGLKGIRTIARTEEVFFGIILIMLLVNVVFVKTQTDFARVLPIFSEDPSDLAKAFPRYGVWLGDFVPFVFVRLKNKKLPYIAIGVTGTLVIMNLIVLLGCAIYGDALKSVTDLYIRISGFNQLSKDVGRMEWTNLFGMLASSIISLSFAYFGTLSACERALNTNLPAKIGFPAVILISILFIPSAQSVTEFMVSKFGYGMFSLAIFLPVTFIMILTKANLKYPHFSRLMNDEYIVRPKSDTIPNSLAGKLPATV